MTIYEIVNEWCDKIIVDIDKEYNSSGRRASGAFGKSMFSDVKQTDKKVSVKIEGADYIYWMENGRKPSSKYPPISAIKQWIEDKHIVAKGISENSLAFLIARKISIEGYKGKPLISKVITQKRLDDLKQSISLAYITDIKSDIINTFKNGS